MMTQDEVEISYDGFLTDVALKAGLAARTMEEVQEAITDMTAVAAFGAVLEYPEEKINADVRERVHYIHRENPSRVAAFERG